MNEARTRKELIDPALAKAGWNLHNHQQVGLEIPVDGYDREPWNGITDYCLYRPDGQVIAVVEAKRTSRDPRLAETQAVHYVTEIEKRQTFRPFAFLTNGLDIYFLDYGVAPKRPVYGFFTPGDLDNLLFIRQQGKLLSSIAIDNAITDRAYQHEAIRRASEAFSAGKRKALLVMATGTGKTRTVMSLIDVFMRANQARKVLFVADRDALVEQARTDGFQKFLPEEPCSRIFSHDIDTTSRLYVVTLQTLSQIFEQFSPAFFDLIIFDEVHRSIFNRFNEVTQYFDARMIGLTATPAQFIERDTFRVFDCLDGRPTFLYTYQQAIADGYLVDYNLYAAQTHYQSFGIHGPELSEEDRNSLIEQGLDPDGVDYTGTDLEVKVSNEDTLRRQWEELWRVMTMDQSGQLPGKTIIFAMTEAHALRIQKVFDEMYPQFPGLCQVITHHSEYRGTLIDKFKHQEMPRIAISVDMLDTGVDVPEVTNLVFMKPVQSRIKQEQMIGRGTRSHAACRPRLLHLLPNGEKHGFLIIDFWDNQFNKPAEEAAAQELPVLVAQFNTRLKLLENGLDDQSNPDNQRVIAGLRGMIARIPTGSFSVRRILPDIEAVFTDSWWSYLVPSKLDFLRGSVGPLLRFAPDVDVAAETFIHKIERLKLQLRTGRDPRPTAESICEDVSYLPDDVQRDPHCEPALRRCTPAALLDSSEEQLSEVAARLSEHMKRKRRVQNFLFLNLSDHIEINGYILLTRSGEQVYVKEYRQRVEAKILAIVENHPVLQAIARGQPVDELQLLELERTLQRELTGGDLEATPENLRKAYGVQVNSFLEFLRGVLELDALPDYDAIVGSQFQRFITTHRYNADQIRFLRAVQSVFLQKRRLALEDLYEAPLSNFGENAVERWFSPQDIDDLLKMTEKIRI